MNYRGEIAKMVVALGEYYDKILTPTQFAMYVEDLADMTPANLAVAVKRYRMNPANDRFPLPAKLRAAVYSPETPDAAAREAVGQIISAVARIGPYDSERARKFVGPLGWLVVVRQGGWETVCEMLTFQNQGILQAQWRELAIALSRYDRPTENRLDILSSSVMIR